MFLRATTGAFTVLMIGLAGAISPAAAQYYPSRPYSRPMPPPVQVDDEDNQYDQQPAARQPSAVRGYTLPPPGGAGQQGAAIYPESSEPYPGPPVGGYGNEPVPGYEPVDPRSRQARPGPGGQGYGNQGYGNQGYGDQGYGNQQYGNRPAGNQPYGNQQYGNQQYGNGPYDNQQPGGYYEPADPRQRGGGQEYGSAPPIDILRPPGGIGGRQEARPYEGRPSDGRPSGEPNAVMSALPPEDRPETGPRKELPPQFRRTMVDFRTKEPAGTLVIDTPNTYLYLVLGNGKAMRYGVGVGREGFTWSGAEKVTRMAEWPDWHPPTEMIERQPYLPRFMAGGDGNPLGARALYLGKTLYRIHGTNQPSTIGTFVSSGCVRLTNEDIADLYTRVQVGTRVVVLPGRPPATASAAPVGQSDGQPYNPLATRR
jgi:lipoprotein-anchoring transpeptidase ErfK/SrfK